MWPSSTGSSPDSVGVPIAGLIRAKRARPCRTVRQLLSDEIADEVRQRHGRAVDLAVVVLQIAYASGGNAAIGLQRRQVGGIKRRRGTGHHPKAAVERYGNEIRDDD